MTLKTPILILIAGMMLNGCAPSQSVSVLVSNSYVEKTNTTDYIKMPYGSIQIPGKWTKTGANAVSRQEFFKNADTVSCAVALTLQRQFSFYQKNMSDSAFLNAFYEWETSYLIEQIKGQRSILKTDSLHKWLVCRIYNNSDVDSYFLFGADNGKLFNLSVSTNKWDQQQKSDFLEAMYKTHKASSCCN